MKISFHWLQEFVEIPLAPRELAERLTMAGVEVEGVEVVQPAFEKVVVGRIKDIRPSHQAEGLLLCQVDVGTSVLPILCGARNISAGNFVPVALPGALLPGGRRIEEAIVRGERSAGMLCSEQELGLGEEGSGILILEGDIRPGLDLTEALKLEDHVLEVAVTPNRGDCLSHWGIAREIAALTGAPLRLEVARLRETGAPILKITSVTVEAKDLCRRYAARVVQGVRVGPSPFWLRRRLSLAGVRPINNVVDATNYVMLETGQPLHAFDLARLAERRIIVRRARAQERITTLDGQERALGPDVLAICDARSPVAVAGIMGGIGAAVTDRTQEILLESASFDPVSVRRTGRQLALASESAYRFERGVDPGGTVRALDRAAQLVTDVAGGRVARGILDIGEPIRRGEITLRHGRVPMVLGTPIPKGEVAEALRRLGCRVRGAGRGRLRVSVPTHRGDLAREIDLIEEIIRLYGFGRIPTSMPQGSPGVPRPSTFLGIERATRKILVAAGYQEVVNFSFTPSGAFDTLRLPATHSLRQVVAIRNPLAGESVLRSLLLPSLLECLQRNEARGVRSARIFETARVYRPGGEELPVERLVLGVLSSGERALRHWSGESGGVDFYDLRGLIEVFGTMLGIPIGIGAGGTVPFLHPGRQATLRIGEAAAGWIGQVHPEVQQAYELGGRPVALELDLAMVDRLRPVQRTYRPLPRFPAVARDVAVIAPETLPAESIAALIRSTGGALVEEVSLFDRYQGDPIPVGHVSLAFTVRYRSPDRTLTDEEVNRVHAAVRAALVASLGVEIR